METLLRWILALAPPEFRDRRGEELLEVHRARRASVGGIHRRIWFGVREATGALHMVVRLRLGRWREGLFQDDPSGPRRPARLESVWQDLRFGGRTLRRHPGFSLSVILVFALGIGATTAIFSAANAYLFRPLPFQNEERLVRIYETNPEFGWTHAAAAPANALDWREQVHAFQDIALYSDWVSQVTVIQDGEPELVGVTSVSGNFFDVLGVQAALGRTFTWEETWDPLDDVVVLSHGLWIRLYGSDPGIVGRTVEFVAGRARVVGVMPPGFSFPSSDVEIWTPWGWNGADREATWFRRAHWVLPVARLASGISLEEANAQLQVVVDRLQLQYPETNQVMGAGIAPFRDFLIREVQTPLMVLMGAVVLLLALACTNVANLLLIRGAGRVREISVRYALGARRTRVARQVLTESMLLALVGGMAGLGLGWLGVNLMERLIPIGIDGATGIALDHRVLLFAIGSALACGALFGLAPAFRVATGRAKATLTEGGRGAGSGPGASRAVNLLVAAEVALALVLAVGGGLMVRSFVFLRQVDPGFRTEGTLAVQVSAPSARYPERGDVLAFYDNLLARLEGSPGIEAAGTVGNLPLNGPNWSSQFQAEGWPPERVGFEILHRRADRGYFEALGIPLLRGRMFDSADDPDGPLVVLINETFAREHFPGEDPIGQKIAYDRAADESSTWYEIVGIVGDQHQVSPGQPPRAEAFENRNQDWGRDAWVVVKTPGDPMAILPAVRSALEEMDPLIPLAAVRPLREVWAASMAQERFVLTLLSLFGLVALVLASVGVYGVTAQAARKRTHEIGIRMAMGAADREILGLMLRRGMVVVGMGLVAGLVLVFAGTRILSSLLYGVEPTDPLTLVTGVGTLAAVALLACFLPARRATAVDPVDSLRTE